MEERNSKTFISNKTIERIREDKIKGYSNPLRAQDDDAVRRVDAPRDRASVIRPAFVRDVEKILHLPVYNRYSDKTQVFSLYKNDDITRRGLHVQIVSRIARDIGAVLGLNLDLIEAIALGHDIGHAPFGHAGERFLSELYNKETGRYFCHNAQSVRVLDTLYKTNLTLQTLDGILCHNGELELMEYRPAEKKSFKTLDEELKACFEKGEEAVKKLKPYTLEGCVVRICDIIAYLGKDRQDAWKAAKLKADDFKDYGLGKTNAQIITSLTHDLIENSYKNDYLKLSEKCYAALKDAKQDNNKFIYRNPGLDEVYESTIKPMFLELYYKLLDMAKEAKDGDESSVLFKHHIENIEKIYKMAGEKKRYIMSDLNDIVVDYIASMTDDYFIELCGHLFNGKYKVEYYSYFNNL